MAFNLTIRVDNGRHLWRVCWSEEMSMITYYNEANAGYNETSAEWRWSMLPAFCVDRWSAVDLGVTLSIVFRLDSRYQIVSTRL